MKTIILLLVVLFSLTLSVVSLPLGVDSQGRVVLHKTHQGRDLQGTKPLRTNEYLFRHVEQAKKNQHQRSDNQEEVDGRLNFDPQGRLTVQVILSSDEFMEEVTKLISNNGGRVIVTYDEKYIDACVSTQLFDKLYQMEDKVNGIRSIAKPIAHTGSVTTEAAPTLGVSTAALRYNFNGSGITIGVISDSVSLNGGGLSQSISTGDLPPMSRQQIVKEGTSGEDEARGMAEVIYDIAPGVNFKYYCPASPADMATGIQSLANLGCKVIVDDLTWLTDAWYSDGAVATGIQTVVKNKGVSYFTAAGNWKGDTYEAGYSSTPTSKTFQFSDGQLTYASCHNFPGGVYAVPIPSDGKGAQIVLQWSQKRAVFAVGTVDLDILIADFSVSPPVVLQGSGVEDQLNPSSRVDPIEIGKVKSWSSSYKLCVCSINPTTVNTRFILLWSNYQGNFGLGTAWYPSIVGHPLSTSANAVAAVNYAQSCRGSWTTPTGCSTGTLPANEYYSSVGGLRTYYNSSGSFITGAPARPKPDMSGIDCGRTSFFGTDVNGVWRFCGTSAAAPGIAAVAALLLQKCPGSTPATIRSELINGATDMYAAGFDTRSGNGLVNGHLALGRAVCG